MRVSSRLNERFSFPRFREVVAVEVRPDFDAKERVRQAIDIVDLLGGYLELRRQGRNWVAKCPWHDDHSPSMTINRSARRQTVRAT